MSALVSSLRRSIFPLFFLLASMLVGATGCSDTPVSTSGVRQPYLEEESFESIPGVLVTPRMLQSGDRLIPLAGGQTDLFVNLIGAEVLVEGVIDPSDGALVIRSFLVLTVDGFPVLDGVLHEYDDGFYIEAIQMTPLPEIPEELARHVGKRVWLTIMNDECINFGVLEL